MPNNFNVAARFIGKVRFNPRYWSDAYFLECQCGCGGIVKKKRDRFCQGHNSKGRIFTVSWRENLSKSHLGYKLRPETIEKLKAIAQSPEVKRKVREYRSTQIFPKRSTKIELIVRACLDDMGISYTTNKLVWLPNGRSHRADVAVGNTLIECDGDYWHSRPEVRSRDDYQNSVLPSMGYKVVRLPEKDILNGTFKQKLVETL